MIAPFGCIPMAPGRCHVKHLLGELWHSQGAVLLRAAGRQRCEAGHEKVETRERDEIHRDLPKITVQLSGKAETRRHSAHCCTNEMVQVSVQ